jgi:hypothetical protein
MKINLLQGVSNTDARVNLLTNNMLRSFHFEKTFDIGQNVRKDEWSEGKYEARVQGRSEEEYER